MKSSTPKHPKEPQTQKAVAREAGVSQALVSLVLRGQPVKIPDATRQRILDSVKKVGYVPKNRHIFNTRQNTLAYIRPTVTRGQHRSDWIYDTYDIFFNQFQNHLVEEAHRAGYSLIVRPHNQDTNLASWLEEQNLDGVFWHANDDALARRLAGRLPVVQINRTGLRESDSVCSNMDEAIERGLEYLRAKGHRKILYIPNQQQSPTLETYTRYMEKHGLHLYAGLLQADGRTLPEQIASFFSDIYFDATQPRPTAVITGDHSALFLLNEARKKGGIRIPEDLSLLGIDNTLASRFCDPPLSTFDTRTDEIARVAVSLMFNRLKLPGRPPQHKRISPEFIERQSVASLPVGQLQG